MKFFSRLYFFARLQLEAQNFLGLMSPLYNGESKMFY